MEIIRGSRCPDCGWVVAPPMRICPKHPVEMTPVELSGYGSVLSYTTLSSAPEGFKGPLHIAVVELQEGARIFCHGKQARDLKIGRKVTIECVDGIFYFAHLDLPDRLLLFWKRKGGAPERTIGAVKSAVKRFFRVKPGENGNPSESAPAKDEQEEKENNKQPVGKG